MSSLSMPRMMPRRRLRDRGPRLRSCVIVVGLFAVGIGAAGISQAAWITGKAVIAQWLLDDAWRRALATGEAPKPWPWADIHPVLRLDVPAIDRSMVVLDSPSGEALAFGPGLVFGDLQAGETLVIGGHRDTHLAFLESLEPGAIVLLEFASGRTVRYSTGPGRVVDTRHETIAVDATLGALVLVTCWPFDAMTAGGPLRWVVEATSAQRARNPDSNLTG